LGDGIMDDVPTAVRDFDDAAAEPAGNGLRGPGAERGLADLLEIEDAQIGVPVHVFLLVEARGDPQQRVAVIARRQLSLVFPARQRENRLPRGGRAPAGAAGSAASATANAKASNGARPDMDQPPAMIAGPDGDRRTPAKSRWRRARREESGDCGVKATLSAFVPRRLCSDPCAV